MQATAKTVGLLAIEALFVMLLWPGSLDIGSALAAAGATLGANPGWLDAAVITLSVAVYLEILKPTAEEQAPSRPFLHAHPSRGAR